MNHKFFTKKVCLSLILALSALFLCISCTKYKNCKHVQYKQYPYRKNTRNRRYNYSNKNHHNNYNRKYNNGKRYYNKNSSKHNKCDSNTYLNYDKKSFKKHSYINDLNCSYIAKNHTNKLIYSNSNKKDSKKFENKVTVVPSNTAIKSNAEKTSVICNKPVKSETKSTSK